MDTKRETMIPEEIPKVYFTIHEVAEAFGISVYVLEKILDLMRSKKLIKVSRDRAGSIRLTAKHIEKLKPIAKEFKSKWRFSKLNLILKDLILTEI